MDEYLEVVNPFTGFLTYGNATILSFDESHPVLATDPWIDGTCYFGSWSLPVLPSKSLIRDLASTKYVWFSHGHPDHLHIPSLKKYFSSDTIVLLPDHYGSRIFRDLSGAGFLCQKLISGKTYTLSKNIKITCLPDYYQDAILILQIGDNCTVLNLNDSQSILQRKKVLPFTINTSDNFALKLVNFGDADVLTYCDNDWNIIPPPPKHAQAPLGISYTSLLKKWNCNMTSPFSSAHIYSHRDTLWISSLVASAEDHFEGFDQSVGLFIPQYFYYDASARSITPISYPNSKKVVDGLIQCSIQEQIQSNFKRKDIDVATSYFQQVRRLRHRYKSLTFYGPENSFSIDLNPDADLVAEFAYPPHLVIKSIKSRTFDNLLISNLGKVRLSMPTCRLHPSFSIPVTRLGDNAGCYSKQQISRYRSHYLRIYKLNFLSTLLQDVASTHLYNILRKTYVFPIFQYLWRQFLKWI